VTLRPEGACRYCYENYLICGSGVEVRGEEFLSVLDTSHNKDKPSYITFCIINESGSGPYLLFTLSQSVCLHVNYS
jgi:hypothetical protein